MGEYKGYIRNVDEKGSINISEDVIAVIVAAAATEVEGVQGLFYAYGKELTNIISKKGLSKGVKLLIEEDNVAIDIYIMAEMGYPVNEMGAEIQRNVMSAVESAVGVTVKAVNGHICGVSLNKSRKDV
jgi:uncharacterized alkaline shock family protein YloU